MGSEGLVVNAFVNLVVKRATEEIAKVGMVVPRLLSVAQAAAYLGRSEPAVRHMQSFGVLRVVKPDSRVQFDRADLDAFRNVSTLLRHLEA